MQILCLCLDGDMPAMKYVLLIDISPHYLNLGSSILKDVCYTLYTSFENDRIYDHRHSAYE